MISKYITQIFWGERYEWQVSLKPDEVLKLIGSKNQGSWLELLFSPGVGIKTTKDGFNASNMSICKIPLTKNSFAHVLFGQIFDTPYGSKVTARFRLTRPAFIFTIYWLGLVFAFSLFAGFTIIYDTYTQKNISLLPYVAAAIVTPIFAILFLKFFRYLSKKNEDEVIYILNETLIPHKFKYSLH